MREWRVRITNGNESEGIHDDGLFPTVSNKLRDGDKDGGNGISDSLRTVCHRSICEQTNKVWKWTHARVVIKAFGRRFAGEV